MIRRFLRDTAGTYAIAMTVALVPIMGGLALALDYSELTRQKQATLNALDAAAIATARELVSGADEEAVIAYARKFFDANLGPVDPADAELFVTLPTTEVGGGTLKLSAELVYQPHFLPAFRGLMGKTVDDGDREIAFGTSSEVRLKNTLEVALVLDNSGSMDYLGSGSGEKRLALLKDAAKQLVETIALQAQQMKQVEKPVQFSLVPFAASVNVGPYNDGATWMDLDGKSPVHHENFDWTTLTDPDKTAENIGGVWRKVGVGWEEAEGQALTRFSLFRDMTKVASREWVATGTEWVCSDYDWRNRCDDYEEVETGYYEATSYSQYASWQGCVEARSHPYNVNGAPASATDPASLFVPMFAPDEPGDIWESETTPDPENYQAANNWWNDEIDDSRRTQLRNAAKYFEVRPYEASSKQGVGPNYSCTTRPLTPLTDVTEEGGLTTIETAIDEMQANGGTNVPEGIAWGWHTVSSGEPFGGSRAESERGNDKVVIVLTDGENTYYTPSSLGYSDPASMRSTYSAHGYLQPGYDSTGVGRLYLGTSINGVYSNSNYTKAMNEHMAELCENAKEAGIIIMSVALDLNASNSSQATAISALRTCASDSRFRKDPDDHTKPAKLFWNATGATLSDNFKEIADELSNLRIVK
ncbi:pilus assembly protein TadG-related protein [Mesorhizobium sp. CAU 1741]|uniref:pilus assembly protein TadG-related protein n=1 Tax=Mesorhizobium sp. CAU 1741 TaxID=3140366 RepID=UPI00325BEF18